MSAAGGEQEQAGYNCCYENAFEIRPAYQNLRDLRASVHVA